MLVDGFWDFGESDEQELEIKVSCDDSDKADHYHAGHTSAKGKSDQKDHDDVCIMVFNFEFCWF